MSVVYINEMMSELIATRNGGSARKGFKSGVHELDELALFSHGLLAIVTGYSGCGKSEFIDHLALCWAQLHGFRTLYFSPENHPVSEHARKHIERVGNKPLHKMSKAELAQHATDINDYFGFIRLDDTEVPSIDKILALAEAEMKVRPFQVLVLDPWNECAFYSNEREDLFISMSLTKIKKFLRKYNVLGIMVAHPRTPYEKVKDELGREYYPVPRLHNISGGSIWYNKADWGVVLHRFPTDSRVRIQLQKVKYKSLGKIGEFYLDYDYPTGRYKSELQPAFTLPNEEMEPPV